MPAVWHEYKHLGQNVLPPPTSDEFGWEDVPDDVDEFLVRIWREYAGYSALGLRAMTHREDPWRDAFFTSHDSPAISLDAMRKHFAGLQLPNE